MSITTPSPSQGRPSSQGRSPGQQLQVLRRRRQQRQTLIFGTLIVGLIVVALIAISIIAGVVQAPFEREFTQPALNREEDAPPLVCAPPDSLALHPEEVTVYVFNGTSTMGLAQSVSEHLSEVGFEVAEVANASEGLLATARISANAQNIVRAYTVATYFQDAEVVLDARPDDTVDVVIGTGFTAMADPAVLDRGPGTPILSLPYCEAAEEIVPEPAPERYVVEATDESSDGSTDADAAETEEPADAE